MIDLHLHSTCSDGSETPEQLVRRARRLGLTALSLTDHDTLAGTGAFLAACREQGLVGLPGVELSLDVAQEGGTLHLLGYGIDPAHPGLGAALARVRAGRETRNRRILEALGALGLALDEAAVQGFAGDTVVGRVHIAQALAARGHVASVAEAFDRYLAKGRPAYVNRYRLTAEEALGLIRAAGGAAVLAHPFTWRRDEARLEDGLRSLARAGLAGLEAYHSDHTPEQTVTLLRLANRLGLLTTGGSDFHGRAKPDVELGRGRGALSVPETCLTRLAAALGGGAPWLTIAKEGLSPTACAPS